MKYIDIKKDALRLMGIIPDTVDNEYDTAKVRQYVLGMNNSIARAVDRMKSLSLIPPKTIEIGQNLSCGMVTLDLSKLGISGEIIDLLKLDGTRTTEEDFALFSGKLTFYFDSAYKYYLRYISSFDNNFRDEDDLEIPEELARLIPYFIKADLYEEEEPSISMATRNMFEGYLREYADKADLTERGVKAVYLL